MFKFFKARRPSAKDAEKARKDAVVEKHASVTQRSARAKNPEMLDVNPDVKPSVELDEILASKVDFARKIAEDTAGTKDDIGRHIATYVTDEDAALAGEISATHIFESKKDGYVGWQWAVVLSRTANTEEVTVCESALVAGESSLLAPRWIPWVERLKTTDIGSTDTLPYDENDDRLQESASEEVTNDTAFIRQLFADEDEATVANLAIERARILSPYGKQELATRWYEGAHGPFTASTRIAPERCMSCGFYVPLMGDLGQLFGVCANGWSRDDGRVVSSNHGCGAHSETDIKGSIAVWNDSDPLIDDVDNVEVFD